MKVLIACEFSGTVRDAFAARGHDAWSCDLLPSEKPGQHIQCDHDLHLLDIIDQGWDLLIFHYPCTYLANSGVRWLYGGKGAALDPERFNLMLRDALYFKTLLECPVNRICGENPIQHGHAQRIIRARPTQIIQPWQFGHGETKATCLWLKNLPPLSPTHIVSERKPRVHFASPGPDRWKERSRTLPGIAKAMADQWS